MRFIKNILSHGFYWFICFLLVEIEIQMDADDFNHGLVYYNVFIYNFTFLLDFKLYNIFGVINGFCKNIFKQLTF